MAIAEGVTEIQDSEEEPMTSSPIKFPDIVVDKVSAEEPDQGPQAAAQDLNGIQQADASQVCAVLSNFDHSLFNHNHDFGDVVEPKVEMQPNMPTQQEGATGEVELKQSTTDETLNVENAEVNEQLCVGHDLENDNLPLTTKESEHQSKSQIFLEDNLSVVRHSSPPAELCGSSIPPCDPLTQAMDRASMSTLGYTCEKLQQVQPDHKEQPEVGQADNDTLSDPAVNVLSLIPAAITEHDECMKMRAEHDSLYSTALPTPVATENTNNEQFKEAALESTTLIESPSIRGAVIDPVPTDNREAKASNCHAPMVVDEVNLDAKPWHEGQSSSLSTRINDAQTRDYLSGEEGRQQAQGHSTSGVTDEMAASVAASSVDMEIDSFLEATGSTITTHPTSSEPTSATSSTQSVVPRSPQEITLAQLKEQKATLLASLVALPAIQVVIEEQATLLAGSLDDGREPGEADVMAAANKIVKEHIKLLHEYNELKDMGQGLMGLIADQRGARIVEVQSEFGIEAQD